MMLVELSRKCSVVTLMGSMLSALLIDCDTTSELQLNELYVGFP